jgi:hypothetical protein
MPNRRGYVGCSDAGPAAAIEPVAHFLAGLEVWHRLLVDLDRLVGARIATDAGGALFHCEGTEPTQLDALAAR